MLPPGAKHWWAACGSGGGDMTAAEAAAVGHSFFFVLHTHSSIPEAPNDGDLEKAFPEVVCSGKQSSVTSRVNANRPTIALLWRTTRV